MNNEMFKFAQHDQIVGLASLFIEKVKAAHVFEAVLGDIIKGFISFKTDFSFKIMITNLHENFLAR